MLLPNLQMSADMKLTSNGVKAKTAKVSIVARTGEPANVADYGTIVHDFDGMQIPNRIPIDWEHGENIGYLNHFDTSGGDLVCTGALVLADDETSNLAAKMAGGVPYQASIDHKADDDCVLEYVPAGQSTTVGGVRSPQRTVEGPVTVVRSCKLRAVALCKYGADSGTSAVMMSKKNNEPEKGFFIRFGKQTVGELVMNDSKEPVTAVDTAAETAPVAVVEAVVEAKADQHEEVKQAETAEAVVEATEKPQEELAAVAMSDSKPAVQMSIAEVAKKFVSTFGAADAAIYMSDGVSYDDALAKHLVKMSSENADLKKRLATLDRGGKEPVKMSIAPDGPAKKAAGLSGAIRLPGAK